MQRYARVPVLLLLTHRSLCLFLVKQQQRKQREQKQTQEEEEERRQDQVFFFIKKLINIFLAIFLTAATEKKIRGRLSLEKDMRFCRRILRGKSLSSPYLDKGFLQFAKTMVATLVIIHKRNLPSLA
jgi:hypothetical protein